MPPFLLANGTRGRVYSGRAVRAASALAACALLVSACKNILDVKNPNNVVEDALSTPSAAAFIANGAGATVTRALTAIYSSYHVVTDELTYVGSRDAYGYGDRGEVSDPFNEFTDAAFPEVGEARFTASNAVRLLKEFNTANTLIDKNDLARALLYEAFIFTSIGEMFDDFVIDADKQRAGPPVGEGNMSVVFDSAIAQATAGIAITQSLTTAAARDNQTRLLAVRARARHSKAIWGKLNGAGGAPATTPVASPLVSDAQADADAQAALALMTGDYRFRFTPGVTTTGSPNVGFELNNRLELRAGDNREVKSTDCNNATCDQYVVPNAAGNAVLSTKYRDPVTNIVDPVLTTAITDCCIKGPQNSNGDLLPFTIISARSMLLIRAEHALANNNTTAFRDFVNQIRSFNSTLTPYDGVTPAPVEMLKHTRFVNLYFQGQRLMDLHRFGIKPQKWTTVAEAYSKACFFPVTDIERKTHPADFVKPLCRPN